MMENRKRGDIRGAIYVAAAALCWGIFPSISRALYAVGISPLEAAVMRGVVCAVIYAVYGAFKGAYRTLNFKECALFFVMGMFTVVGMYVFYMLALDEVSTAVAVTLLYTAPAFVIIFDRIFYKERITRIKLISLVMTLLGCALAAKLFDFAALTVNAKGVIFGLLAGISYSMVTVFGKRMVKVHSAETTAVMPALFGGLVLCCIKPVWTIAIPSVWAAIGFLALGVIGSVVPNMLYNKGLATGLDGGRASLIATIEPVTATLMGIVVFADSVSPIQFIGMALVLAGAAMQFTEKG